MLRKNYYFRPSGGWTMRVVFPPQKSPNLLRKPYGDQRRFFFVSGSFQLEGGLVVGEKIGPDAVTFGLLKRLEVGFI